MRNAQDSRQSEVHDGMQGHLAHLVRLTDIGADDFDVLRRHADRTRGWIDELTSVFYDALFDYPPTRELFHAGERASREASLRGWLAEALSGDVDDDFWHRQWIVGLLHVKRHVDSQHVVAMMGRLNLVFLRRSLEQLDPSAAVPLVTAFRKLTDVVTGLVSAGHTAGYRQAISDVTGMSTRLIDRMADVAVDTLLRRARGADEDG